MRDGKREKREERGVYGVVGGPASVTAVNEDASGTLDASKPSEAPMAEIERVWTDAVLHQEYPPSAPRD